MSLMSPVSKTSELAVSNVSSESPVPTVSSVSQFYLLCPHFGMSTASDSLFCEQDT